MIVHAVVASINVVTTGVAARTHTREADPSTSAHARCHSLDLRYATCLRHRFVRCSSLHVRTRFAHRWLWTCRITLTTYSRCVPVKRPRPPVIPSLTKMDLHARPGWTDVAIKRFLGALVALVRIGQRNGALRSGGYDLATSRTNRACRHFGRVRLSSNRGTLRRLGRFLARRVPRRAQSHDRGR